MADITDQHDQTSPNDLDESHAVGNGSAAAESRGIKRQRAAANDDDDDDDEKGSRERRKIEIKFISDKSRRHITFSKRKAGIMKKVSLSLAHAALELSTPCPKPEFSASTMARETQGKRARVSRMTAQ
jgi:MADS-box transcription factor